MKEHVELYLIRYGLRDTLTQIADGLSNAALKDFGLTDFGKRQILDAAAKVYEIRNRLERAR